ncbi:MAG TPA: MlaD family protein [Candidatus Angelobacter sp.]|nr:MlaD family protein [Candidatus Angelobacter sp.]
MPSQKQLRWSELRVGITVIIASVTLAVLVFAMRGASGLFTSKITAITYFDNAEGLRQGQPVDLQGVPIGNVTEVRIVRERPLEPVQVKMRINRRFQDFVRTDTKATILTAGVLGESFIDLDSTQARGPVIQDGQEIKSSNAPGLQDVVRSSQTTLTNLDILVKRLDRIVSQVESGKGTLGEVINDPALFNKANNVLNQLQGLLNDVNNGRGTIGKFFSDDSLYRKADDLVDKLDRIVDDVNSGRGNLGKLVKDDTLMVNANQTIVKANKLIDDVNAGKGALGKLAKDEAFAARLQNTVDKLSAIADRLDAGEGSAGRLLRDPSVYNNTDQLLVETRTLIKAVRENPKKYLTIRFRIF